MIFDGRRANFRCWCWATFVLLLSLWTATTTTQASPVPAPVPVSPYRLSLLQNMPENPEPEAATAVASYLATSRRKQSKVNGTKMRYVIAGEGADKLLPVVAFLKAVSKQRAYDAGDTQRTTDKLQEATTKERLNSRQHQKRRVIKNIVGRQAKDYSYDDPYSDDDDGYYPEDSYHENDGGYAEEGETYDSEAPYYHEEDSYHHDSSDGYRGEYNHDEGYADSAGYAEDSYLEQAGGYQEDGYGHGHDETYDSGYGDGDEHSTGYQDSRDDGYSSQQDGYHPDDSGYGTDTYSDSTYPEETGYEDGERYDRLGFNC